MSILKNGFFGREGSFHHILKRKYAAGLVADLQTLPWDFKTDSMDHQEYFEKYLMEPEGLDRVLAAIKTICHYEMPDTNFMITSATIPHLEGVNQLAAREIGDNVNKIIILFENFPKGAGKDSTGASGHFELMWHFPETFDKKEATAKRFCFFDPFGRERPKDPERSYFQKSKYFDYQYPESSTCALWCIFALIQFALKTGKFPGVAPIEYDGKESTLDEHNFVVLHEPEWLHNERTIYNFFIRHYFIFKPRIQPQRALTAE